MKIIYIGKPGGHLRNIVANGDDVYVADLVHIDYETVAEKISVADEAHICNSNDGDSSAATSVAFYLGLAAMFKWSQWNPDFRVVMVTCGG